MTSLNDSLVKITKGTGIAFFGALLGMLFAFLGRLLVARFGTEAQYGVFSLAAAVLNICVVIATLGLQQGVSRSIAYARGINESPRVQKLMGASVQWGLLASICLGMVVFFISDVLATRVFHDAALALPLKIFAFGAPFLVLIGVFTAIFRGFGDIKPTVYFDEISRSALFPLLLLPVVFLNLPFTGVFYAFLASLVVSCAVLIIYAVRRLPFPVELHVRPSANPVAKELLSFSLPLLAVAMLHMIVAWTDTLMLGGLKSSADVGLYNAAHPLAAFISTPLTAMLLVYLPVTSGLYARGSMLEIRRDFSILTKWLWAATLPLFLILFLFPETVLTFLFGASYTSAEAALRILSIGYMVNNLLGPNGSTLIAMGKARFIMWTTLGTALTNVGLNSALIPPLGMEGAAIASIATIICGNLVRCWKLYSLSKAQPLSKNLIKPTLVSLGLIFLFQLVFKNFVSIVWWMLPLLFILYYAIYGVAILFTKSFDQEDISMLLAVEQKVGLNLSFVKRILRRFL